MMELTLKPRSSFHRALVVFSTAAFIRTRLLNALGLHVFRVCLINVIYFWSKRRRLHPLSPKLAREGCLIVPKFLPQDDFAKLKAAADAGWVGYADRVDHAAWGHTALDNLSIDDDTPHLKGVLMETVLRNPEFVQLITDIECGAPFERLMAPGDRTSRCYLEKVVHGGDHTDEQQDLHVDIFFPSLQVFLYLEDVNNDDGPFCYLRYTHLIRPMRLFFEYLMSLQNPANAGWRIPGWLARMHEADEVVCAAQANTLVIANTQGFHKRGPAAHGKTRYSLRFGFRTSPLGALLKVA